MEVTFESVGYDHPTAQLLIEELQAEYVVRYGGPDDAPVEVEAFLPPRGLMLIGAIDGAPVCMGSFRPLREGVCEIKRMYVRADHRRRGLSRLTLATIEDAARDAGYQRVELSTGTEQPEAMALYESAGFETVAGFGHFEHEPLSRFYGKDL